MPPVPIDTTSAYRFLKELGASERLLFHATAVCEAGEELIQQFQGKGISVDAAFVRAGATLHDAGKIAHPEELDAGGNRHEEAGRELLLRSGCDLRLARVCVSHARWQNMECSLEELLIALADNLWKGKRNEALEERVIDVVVSLLGGEKWAAFSELDSCFEAIAARGPQRLSASRRAL